MSAERSNSLTGVTAVVFIAGFVMEMYGLYFVLAEGAALKGLVLIGAGLLLQVAGGAFGGPAQHGTGLVNPFGILRGALGDIRTRVRSWEGRR